MLALALGLAAFEATRHVLGLSPRFHLISACVLTAYGLATLSLLKPAIALRAFELVGDKTVLERPVSRLGLMAHAGFLLFFRVSFVIAALAYLAQALSLGDPSFLRGAGSPGYASFLLTIFDATFPPLSALTQYIVPTLEAATFNSSNTWALVFKGLVYVSYTLLAVAVVKDIWSLGYNARVEDLLKVVDVSKLAAAVPADSKIKKVGVKIDLDPYLERELREAVNEASKLRLPQMDRSDEWFVKRSKIAREWAEKRWGAGELWGMARTDYEQGIRDRHRANFHEVRKGWGAGYKEFEEILTRRLVQVDSALSQVALVLEGDFSFSPSYEVMAQYLELLWRFARFAGVHLPVPST